jgi:cyclopropane fatty-acyl-phospholipid synthase-like methyltransferase
MEQSLPYSQACENNKLPLLNVFQRYLVDKRSLLEIGGGTGQHAVFFTDQFPDLYWQASDVPANIASLNQRLSMAQRATLPLAIQLNVDDPDWNCEKFDVIFTANSLHIMSAASVEQFFTGVRGHLKDRGLLLVYGPFKYNGEYTTESNAEFDRWLKNRDANSGVRDFEWINQLAQQAGLKLLEDIAMPANNQVLVWQ